MYEDKLKVKRTDFIHYYFSLALQREQFLRDKKMGSDAYRKALDAQVNSSSFFLPHYCNYSYNNVKTQDFQKKPGTRRSSGGYSVVNHPLLCLDCQFSLL